MNAQTCSHHSGSPGAHCTPLEFSSTVQALKGNNLAGDGLRCPAVHAGNLLFTWQDEHFPRDAELQG